MLSRYASTTNSYCPDPYRANIQEHKLSSRNIPCLLSFQSISTSHLYSSIKFESLLCLISCEFLAL
uniref:Uncharacterized protein n=1 Tax=Rhizophora mucronata TaxID=61149 RepID=A0A2P2J028_RHIMU